MTLRDAIDTAIEGRELGLDPAEVLADHGFGDLPPDVLSSAFEHFAGSSSMEMADKLAPIVTRLSPVPFEEGDLASFDGADDLPGEGADPLALLDQIELSDEGLDDTDPVDFDLEAIDEALESVDASAGPSGDTDDPLDIFDSIESTEGSPFGTGDESVIDDALEQIESVGTDAADSAPEPTSFEEDAEDAIVDQLDELTDEFDVLESATDGDFDSDDPADFDDFE